MKYDYYLFYKPFQVLCQFSPEGNKKTLADFLEVPKDVYPVGRLDYDSEGLLLLTNDKSLNAQMLTPGKSHEREYWVQVEGAITHEALTLLSKGVTIRIDGKEHHTLPAKARQLETAPDLPERNPPIRYRAQIPTSWISLTLTEGKNRQVRRMTAAVGFPTLRLVRWRIGKVNLKGLEPGNYRTCPKSELQL
ncbi:MAG: pseudouridine synthase [Chitinophagaceae bacterium]|nr:pseudouridine synthase [Chitinophagaceae bacterium]